MIEADSITSPDTESSNRQFNRARLHNHAPALSTDARTMQLEIENSRLQRLVAELLLKNQQLRKDREQD
jgi:hypothetical protein